MNKHRISLIKRKFTAISTISFFGALLVLGGLIYFFSEATLRNEVRQITAFIISNDGEIPNHAASIDAAAEERHPEPDGSQFLGDGYGLNLEMVFGTKGIIDNRYSYVRDTDYLAVLFDNGGSFESTVASISDYDEESVKKYASELLSASRSFGRKGSMYYRVSDRPAGGKIVVFVDRTAQVAVNHRILFAILFILAVGTTVAFFLMRLLSGRVVRTEINNAERQKQFLTNASHELKTPLAVIRANTEMQGMLEGETEWTQSTMRQVERMSGLIDNLVKIARAEERDSMQMTLTDISAIIEETASSFEPVAIREGKTIRTETSKPLELMTDESMLRQLLTLLVDNAVKYCDAGGSVTCFAARNGHNLDISISNTFAEGEKTDYSRFFDRFYRSDSSHNTEKGGYGIGLSIAESIVSGLKGTIDVSWKNGEISFNVRFPGKP